MTFQVTDNIYKIELPIPFPLETTNVYLIDESPRTLIDTGIKTEASFEALKKGVEEIGVSLSSIERILITHGHIDHYGQAKKLSSLSGARIYIHRIEYGRIRSILHSFGFLKSILLRNGVPQDVVTQTIYFMESAQNMADPLDEAFFIGDGDSIPFDSITWKVVHCPGHSPGLLCFYWPEKKILFTGDHLIKEITPNPVLTVPEGGPPFRYPSLKDYLTSLEKIEKMDLSLLLPGHGRRSPMLSPHPEDLCSSPGTNGSCPVHFVFRRKPFEVAMDLFFPVRGLSGHLRGRRPLTHHEGEKNCQDEREGRKGLLLLGQKNLTST
jgi:glyoxylase-like metal-dependent hydrolase (beta-lactamase superfamily II)